MEGNKILLEKPVTVHEIIKNNTLRYLVKKAPLLDSLLYRLPERIKNKIYFYDYTVTERSVENGFVFMNLYQFSSDSKILDVGCCWNSMAFEFASLGFKTWGIDINHYPLYHPNLTFIKTSICNTSFQDSFFDVITAVSTIEHIGLGHYGDSHFDSDLKAMEEIKRILKPEGTLILTLPYGIKTVTNFFRIYDRNSLLNLIKGFKIIKEIYSINLHEDKYWEISSEYEAATYRINKRNRNMGNVCLLLKKI